jgi:hypothetical protein
VTEPCPTCGAKARSEKSHDHFFARVADCWETLPDNLKERFPNAEHLRKWALVKSGYCNEITFVMDYPDSLPSVVRLVRHLDPYAVIVPRSDVVSVYTAKSQSKKDMGAKDFQESKDAVFRVISELLGTDVSEAA